jgi:hypothetical protein
LNPTVIPPLTDVNRGNSQSTVSSSGIPENKNPGSAFAAGRLGKRCCRWSLFTVNGYRVFRPQEKNALNTLVNVLDLGDPGAGCGRLYAGVSGDDDA